MLATLPAVLGGTAGLMVLVSVTMPVKQKDPHRRTGPFDTGDDPNAAGAAIGQQYLMLLLAALVAVPGGVLVLLGTVRQQTALQVAGVLVGTATGVLLAWWGGRVAARRLADRGAELMDLLHLGPQAKTGGEAAEPAAEAAVPLPRWKSAALGTLWTVGVLCVFPQGLVPIAFNLFGRRPGGQGLVRGPLPRPAAAGPGGGRLHRRGRAGDLVGRVDPAPPGRAVLAGPAGASPVPAGPRAIVGREPARRDCRPPCS